MSVRPGDTRPPRRPPEEPIRLGPCQPVRWLPRHGEPFCVIEFLSQRAVTAVANGIVFVAVIVALFLLAAILTWGTP